MKILLKFPTRNRPEKFFNVLDQIVGLAKSPDYEILVSMDINDKMMANDQVRDRLKKYPMVRAFWGYSKSKIDAVNRDIEFVAPDWDILCLVSDDFEFVKDGFDLRIIELMKEYFPDTDGVLHFNDGTPNGSRLMTLNICGRKYYERFGYIYHPNYCSLYADDENTEVAKMLGKHFYSPEVLFTHQHWLFNKSEPDELNKKNDSQEMYDKDRAVYLKRKENNFGL